MVKGTFLEPLVWFLFAAIAVTGTFSAIYLTGQQGYRQLMNDPQIQMAEDAAARLEAGDVPASVVPRGNVVDLKNSLAPWIAVYDSTGKVLEASGELNNAPPQPPAGVFDVSTWRAVFIGHHLNTAPDNENRFTWQPQTQVRQAIIMVHLSDGRFVAAGRNMSTTEARIIQLGLHLLVAWVFTLGCLFVPSFIGWWLLKPSR